MPEILQALEAQVPSYIEKLKADMPQQFRHRHNLDILLEAFGRQMDEIREFYESMLDRFYLDRLTGSQLDRIGDIVVLSRRDAALLTGDVEDTRVLSDYEYRNYLIYKILLNTSTCTYADLIKGISFFLAEGATRSIKYIEDPYKPAQFILQCDMSAYDALSKLKFIHAGGVGVILEPIGGDIAINQIPYFAYWFDDWYNASGMIHYIDSQTAYVMCVGGRKITEGDQVYYYTSTASRGLYTNLAPGSSTSRAELKGFVFAESRTKTKSREYMKVIRSGSKSVLGTMVLGQSTLGD